MIGWLIYSAVDVEKNKYYIQMYKDKFKEHFIEIKLVIVEELENMEQYVKCNKVDFAINRSRNHIMGELLEQKGVRVFNSSSVTRIANNKGITYEFLKDVVPFLAVKYGNEIIESKIENKGFAAIIKRKQIDLILYGNQNKYRINLDDDIRKYQKNIDYEFEIEGKIPEELKSGQYKAFLSITEPFDTLKNRAEYQIKLSNNGIWDQEINSNYIGDIFIDDNNISSNANLSGKENNSEIRFYIVATIGIIVCLILIRILSK